MGGKGSGGGRVKRKPGSKYTPKELAGDRIIYERQPGESDPAWEAFTLYRDDPERSQRKVAKTTGKHPTLVARWSASWRWRERAEAWDREADDRKRAATLDAIEDMQRRHIQLAQGMQQLAALELQRKLKAAKAHQKDGRLSAKDLKELMDLGTRLERLNRGEPGEHVRVDATQVITVGGKVIKF